MSALVTYITREHADSLGYGPEVTSFTLSQDPPVVVEITEDDER